ncbi:ABC transporter substrate-binding protein [Embleya scabrispora]|uniref:ABC transporter substrate-binding protein n=1 Tax=Embleya scabrispora TaxID=159449 RepID=UPI00036625B9|nr:ABC transporter substrate-binding protein [Embleya scabrispora]MYS86921.1 peptide ABC transporter substrate-binding protein [Streptomyces sp. SID5474]
MHSHAQNARASGPSRRTVLRGAGAAGLLLGLGGALSACERRGSAATVPAGPPRRGGRLRIGMVGAGKSESFNPSGAASALINVARVTAVFDSLVAIGPDLNPRPMLALSWTPDDTAATWTFRLRPGVRWHDGKPFTAEDVIYSLNWMSDPSNQLSAAVTNVDLPRLAAPDPETVIVRLHRPDLLFPQAIAATWIVQSGATDFSRPVGTGPFVFDSLMPGQVSVCRRNPDYWDTGKPYVDSLVIQSISDDNARVNALLGGQIDMVAQIPYAQAKAYDGAGLRLLDSPGITAQGFYMAVDHKPFDDARVRQAMRLLVDRQQLVDVALYGYGTVGNDLFGRGLTYYADAIPQRKRDIARAKALLAQAGHGRGLTVTLETAPAAPGMVEAATLFAQQAADAGVTVHVSQVDASSYFDPTVQYLKRPFGQTLWAGFASLSSFYQYAILPDGPGNETHWNNGKTTELTDRAVSAADAQEAANNWNAVQQEQWDDGGYLWWANVDNVDAMSNQVAGITPSRYLNLGLPAGLTTVYFAS